MTRKYLIVCVILLFGKAVSSQELLTPDEAISQTIENNFGIKIAKKDIEVATNNATRTAVGFGPVVNASAGTSVNLGGSNQKFSNGNENTVTTAASYSGNAAVSGTYTIYDQTRNVSLEQLREVLNLTNLQLRFTIESNILQLMSRYYEVARLASTLQVLDETMAVSNRRVERVSYQYEYGQGLRLDILNAEVDVQRDSINYYNTKQLLTNAKRDLNVIMGLPIDADFAVDTSVIYQALTLQGLRENLLDDNIELQLLDKNVHINQYDLQLIEAEKKPTLGATGTLNYSQQKNPSTAFITSSNSRGVNVGLNLSWNLFDGGIRRIRKQNTEIQLQTLQLQRSQLVQELERDLTNAWESYQNALFILHSEEINLSTSQLNFERTEEQFNLGQASSIEFRQAQLNLLNAATNLNNAKYDAKLIEINLLQLAGTLLAE
ncbi:MAG: TolC family protein [Saprospiraceae bacterium]|nr:TolC family protein [Saprospiraceae bacterium]